MKKLVCLTLVLVCVFSLVGAACADIGVVHGGTLKMRMEPNTTSYVACYLKNGTSVTVFGSATDKFYSIGGKGYQHSNLSGWYDYREGYGMKSYISVD